MIKYSIIIINYKQEELLKKCLSSIYSIFKSEPFEVIVINNSKEDKLPPFNLPNFRIIESENYGYANANNTGAGKAKGKYIFFLNADTEIRNDFLAEFDKAFGNLEFGAAGLKLVYPDGSFQPSCYLKNNFFNEIKNKKLEQIFKSGSETEKKEIEKKYAEIRKVDWVSGAAFIVKRNIFESVGGFDERFFLFYEDADLCKRLSDKGYGIYYYPCGEVIHLKGENANRNFNDVTYYFSKKSQILYYKIHNNLFQRFLIRGYLLARFSILCLINPSRINIFILKFLLGKKNDKGT
ncbi:MAG: glycosyltransferase family 2 protein [Ignavibacteriae bacterium]|nr:glycosyltransferase family 2 protein [Ignavibacteriota bacterium]